MSPTLHAASANLPRTRSRSPWLVNLGLTLPFIFLYWINLAHHEIWFDEINAWGISCAAPTLSRLFYYVHFEGHPWLWYFILWIPSRFTHNPVAMKCVEGLFGTAIYLVLGLLTPFTRLQKLLVLCSYFVIFEYTVMSRMYSVMFLFALLYVLRRTRKPDAVIGNVALLGAVANTDMTGIILSGALLLEYAYDRWTVRRQFGWTPDLKRRAVLAIVVYGAMLAFSVHSLWPSPEISWQASGPLGSEMFRRRRMVDAFGNMIVPPWWPISSQFPDSFWGTDIMRPKALLLLVPVVLFAYWRIFERERNLRILMGLTLGFGMIFADVVYAGHVRHWGIAFVSFLLAMWIQRIGRERSGASHPERWSPWAYALMSLSAVAGVAAIAGSWMHPFNQIPAIAHWIETHPSANVPLVGDQDLTVASVAEMLQRPAYFMECGCTDSFKLFRHDRDSFKFEEMPQRLDLAMKKLDARQVLLVDYHMLTPEILGRMEQESITADLQTSFQGTQDYDHYYVYTVTRR